MAWHKRTISIERASAPAPPAKLKWSSMPVRISVAMLTHNETAEFRWLMQALLAARDIIDEIIVVDDYSGPEFLAAVSEFKPLLPLQLHQRALNKNFARQRNYMKSLCRGRLIFFLDPDELPSEPLLRTLPAILDFMEKNDIDACELPRLNVWVEGTALPNPLSVDLADPTATILWEDQVRLLRNRPGLRWRLRLNEYVVGIRRGYRFPHTMEWALLHVKTKARQARQRVFYKSIQSRHLSRMANSIYKRLPWRKPTQWLALTPPRAQGS
jgi:glycosyltransferase involved in cell wall biosynthesis